MESLYAFFWNLRLLFHDLDECSNLSHLLFRILHAHVLEIVVIHPRRNRALGCQDPYFIAVCTPDSICA